MKIDMKINEKRIIDFKIQVIENRRKYKDEALEFKRRIKNNL